MMPSLPRRVTLAEVVIKIPTNDATSDNKVDIMATLGSQLARFRSHDQAWISVKCKSKFNFEMYKKSNPQLAVNFS